MARAWNPPAIKVEVNTKFAIAAEDELGIDGVIIGCAAAHTLSSLVPATFLITEPGTYPVTLEVAGYDIGTIVVEQRRCGPPAVDVPVRAVVE